MSVLDFGALPLWQNVALFGTAALVVWLAGVRLARLVNTIGQRTGLGKAFLGGLLLGGITSLPEGATTVTASAIGNAPLAANNLLGGIAMQMAVLALADAALRGRALSGALRDSSVLLQGMMLAGLLALVAAAILVGDSLVLGVGFWTTAIFIASIAAFWLLHAHEAGPGWTPTPVSTSSGDAKSAARGSPGRSADSNLRLAMWTILLALLILASGVVLAQTADVLAVQTGLGASFTGVALAAIATSLPEVSTTIGAVRLGAYTMAVSNVIGANILDTSILFLADVVYPGGPVLDELGTFAAVAALLGVLVTSVYMVGTVYRPRRTIAGVGLDSAVVALVYLGGLYLLYTIR